MTSETTGVAERDPFELFNERMGMGRIQNPYPDFVGLRCEAPIVKTDFRKMYGIDGGSEPPPDAPTIYTACTYDAVLQVLRDGETFSSKIYEAVMGIVMGHTILEMDEPEHHRYRALIQQAFTKKALEQWEHSLVRPIVNRCIDEFADEGRAELVRQVTFPFPVNVIAGMLGLPVEDLPKFHRWTVELISVGFDFETATRSSETLRDYLTGILDQRRAEGATGDDLISKLLRAELDGHRLTDDEICAFLRLLLPAGAETTYRSSSNLLYGLLNRPEQLDAVRNDRSLIPQAIEEGVRWEPPLLNIMRLVTRDTEVCGVPIEKGAIVAVNLGAANHDESRWENPEDFDLFRQAQQHLGFAFGPHMCLGMHLARMETRVLLECLFDRLPNMRFDPDAPPAPITGLMFRAPAALNVVFDV